VPETRQRRFAGRVRGNCHILVGNSAKIKRKSTCFLIIQQSIICSKTYFTYTLFTSCCIILSICTDDSNKNIMKRLDQGHLHPLHIASRDKQVSAGNRTGAACATGEHSSKDLFKQLLLLMFGTSTVLMTLHAFLVHIASKTSVVEP
jgi:hypothetical protein